MFVLRANNQVSNRWQKSAMDRESIRNKNRIKNWLFNANLLNLFNLTHTLKLLKFQNYLDFSPITCKLKNSVFFSTVYNNLLIIKQYQTTHKS